MDNMGVQIDKESHTVTNISSAVHALTLTLVWCFSACRTHSERHLHVLQLGKVLGTH